MSAGVDRGMPRILLGVIDHHERGIQIVGVQVVHEGDGWVMVAAPAQAYGGAVAVPLAEAAFTHEDALQNFIRRRTDAANALLRAAHKEIEVADRARAELARIRGGR